MWVLMIVLSVSVVIGVVVTLIPEDPKEVLAEAEDLLQSPDRDAFYSALERLKTFPQYKAEAALLEGQDLSNRDRELGAIEIYTTATESGDKLIRARAQRLIARSYFKLGQFENALKHYEDSLKENPEDPTSAIMLAQMFNSMGCVAHATTYADKVLEAEPDNRVALELRGNLYLKMFEFEQAIETYGKLLKSPGDRATASPMVVRGYVTSLLETQEQHQELLQKAHKELTRSLSSDPIQWDLAVACGETESVAQQIQMNATPESNGHVVRLRARMALVNDDIEQAEKNIRQAILAMPRNYDAFRVAAIVYGKTGDQKYVDLANANMAKIDEARAELTQLFVDISDDVKSTEPREKIVRAQIKLGNIPGAREMVAQIRALDKSASLRLNDEIDALTLPDPFVPFNFPELKLEGLKVNEQNEDE